MKLVFLGPPGAGKGTQAKLLADAAKLAHISTGDMLREAVASGSSLGSKVKSIMDAGELVSDNLIVDLIKDRTSHADCAGGYILDGFPRTVAQAEALQQMLKQAGQELDKVVFFSVSEEALKARLENRRTVEGRSDDNVQTQLERLKVYSEKTAPLIDWYRSCGALVSLDATGSIEEVQQELRKIVDT